MFQYPGYTDQLKDDMVYCQAGCPLGFWLGSGVHALVDGQLRPGDTVTEEQLELLLGMGRDHSPATSWASPIGTSPGSPSASRPASTVSTGA